MALNPLDRIARDMEDVKRQLAGRAQLGHSSLENTAIPVYDGDGTERLRIGAQDDGTHAIKYVQGPPPPRPTPPVVSVDGPVVRVRWDGILTGGHIPEDFSRIDVHFALASEDLESPEAVRANLATSAGNETVMAATQTGTYRVGLVAMSQSRARSEMSDTVEVDVTLVDLEGALDAVVENARGGSNYYQPTPPPGTDHDADRDLWFDTSVGEDGLVSYSPHRWDDTTQEWVSIADQRTAALQEALGDLEGMVDQRLAEAGDRLDGLEESLGELDSTTLPGLRQDLDAAEGRLDTAEGQITDAFGQLDGIPGQISEAQQAAITAAEQDAAQKAQDAQQAAQEHADLVAQGAEADAIAAAEVRAQQLADAAQQAAEEAAQVAAAAAREAAISAARAEMGLIPRPNYGTSEPTHDAPDGSAYFQIDDTARESFAWAGVPHASESIKYRDGVEVARNLSTNPSFETNVDGVQSWPGVTFARSSAASGWAPPAGQRLMFVYYANGTPWSARVRLPNIDVTGLEGKFVTTTTTTRRSSTATINRSRVSLQFSDNTWAWGGWDSMSTAWRKQTVVSQIPAGVTHVTPVVQVEDTARPDALNVTFGVDAVHVAIADTEAAALAQVEEYFDGDTPARTVGGFDKIVAQWERRGDAWVQVPIRSEAIANLDVGKLSAGAAEIAEVVSQKIAGAVGRFLELDVGQLTVTGESKLADVVAEAIAADIGRFIEVEVGRLVAGEGVLDEAVIQKLFAEVVVAQMAFAESFIGTNALLEGSITAESGIIGSLDLGVLIVGKLHGMYIEGQTIDTEQLAFGAATGDIVSADALNFKRGVGLDLVSSSFRAGDAVEITEEYGFRQFGPDGALNVDFPSDGSPASVRGDFSARRLSAQQLQLTGATTIASGADMVIESGVTAPTAAPQVTPYWDRVTMPSLADSESAAGLAWGDGHWWRLVTTTVGLSDGGRTRVEKINTAGQLVGGFDCAFRVSANGLTILGNEIYVLASGLSLSGDGSTPTKPRMVVVYNLAGVEQRRWEYPSYGTGTYQPGIGTNGTDVVIAQCWKTGELTYRRYSRTGTLVAQHDTPAMVGADMTGFVSGNLDYGGFRTVFAVARASQVGWQFLTYTGTGAALTYQRADSWTTPGYHAPKGLAWDGTHLWSLDPDGNLVRYARKTVTGFVGDHADDWWMAVSWRNDPAETLVGPATRFTYPHRAQLLVTVPDTPQGVSGIAFFVAKGESAPTRTQLHWAQEINHVAQTSILPALASTWAMLRNPVGTSSFTDSEPGEIRSALSGFRVDGSGAGGWGPLRFGADGSLRGAGTVITGEVSHPSITAGNLNSHDVTVTFPAGRFTSPPVIMLSHTNGLVSPVPSSGTVTKDSFQLRVWNPHETRNAGSGTVYWAAIERST